MMTFTAAGAGKGFLALAGATHNKTVNIEKIRTAEIRLNIFFTLNQAPA